MALDHATPSCCGCDMTKGNVDYSSPLRYHYRCSACGFTKVVEATKITPVEEYLKRHPHTPIKSPKDP